jgi:hypothetical protein
LPNTTPSERFPIYTRLNANDVLPDPLTPLAATMVWMPHILPGWAAGYVRCNWPPRCDRLLGTGRVSGWQVDGGLLVR